VSGNSAGVRKQLKRDLLQAALRADDDAPPRRLRGINYSGRAQI
jgi:hypothetical protein